MEYKKIRPHKMTEDELRAILEGDLLFVRN